MYFGDTLWLITQLYLPLLLLNLFVLYFISKSIRLFVWVLWSIFIASFLVTNAVPFSVILRSIYFAFLIVPENCFCSLCDGLFLSVLCVIWPLSLTLEPFPEM